MLTKLEEYYNERERRESIENRDVLLSIASLIKTKEGNNLFKYLLRSFEVGNLPEKNEEGISLHDKLGFLRAGNSVYKLMCQADYEQTALILARIERERYDDKLELYRIEQELKSTTTDSDNE